MKIRTGFVSNSSSASFVLRVDMPLKDFAEEYSEEFCFSKKENFRSKLKKDKAELEKSLKQYESDKDLEKKTFLKFFIDNSKERLTVLDKKLQDIEFLSETDTIIDFIDYKGASVEDKGYCIKFTGDTGMYNGFEDVPEIMRNILAMCAYKNIRCYLEVLEDGCR